MESNAICLNAAEALLCSARRAPGTVATELDAANTTPRIPLTATLAVAQYSQVESDRDCTVSSRDNDSEINSQSSVSSSRQIRQTRDQSTQTEGDMYVKTSESNFKAMDAKINDLQEQVILLQEELKAARVKSSSPESPAISQLDPDVSSDELKLQNYKHKLYNYNTRKSGNSCSSSSNTTNSSAMDTDASDECKPANAKPNKHKNNKSSNKMVPIGDGYAKVPARLLKQINWSSPTTATRKLLREVFDRSVLATHSLSGKPSPAFPNKPAKRQLDPDLVNDIVQLVTHKTKLSPGYVRTMITTKCADESKMYRSRQEKQRNSPNQENDPPC